MFHRMRDYAYLHPWRWAVAWGVLVAVLVALTSLPLWAASLVGLGFFLAVGFVRSRQRNGLS
jgi:hypothetical protein